MPKVHLTINPGQELEVDDVELKNLRDQGLVIEPPATLGKKS